MENWYYYKFLPWLGSVKNALKAFAHTVRYRIGRCCAYDWSKEDHQHICIPLRVLETKDFVKVCPCHGIYKTMEAQEKCDHCPYEVVIDFNKKAAGQKFITIYGSKDFLVTH